MKCYHCGTKVEVDRVVPSNSVVLCSPCADKARVKCRDCGAPIIADNHVTIGHPDCPVCHEEDERGPVQD